MLLHPFIKFFALEGNLTNERWRSFSFGFRHEHRTISYSQFLPRTWERWNISVRTRSSLAPSPCTVRDEPGRLNTIINSVRGRYSLKKSACWNISRYTQAPPPTLFFANRFSIAVTMPTETEVKGRIASAAWNLCNISFVRRFAWFS